MTTKYIFAEALYLELGDVLNPHIIGNCSHNNRGSVLTASQPHFANLQNGTKNKHASILMTISHRF